MNNVDRIHNRVVSLILQNLPLKQIYVRYTTFEEMVMQLEPIGTVIVEVDPNKIRNNVLGYICGVTIRETRYIPEDILAQLYPY